MLVVGTMQLVSQQINVRQFIAADIVIITIIGSVEKLIVNLDKIYDAMVSVEKLGKVTEAVKETSGGMVLADRENGVDIQFSNLRYTYPHGTKMITDKNF